ncbi:hypothetical protein BDV59DRAFT_201806 [Aspergillus ambiguus]|uniref:uncharacterized protein n=1 Tax=Aspergillus ambiguus TaxID=176160 RepID=UPI003CCCCDC9
MVDMNEENGKYCIHLVGFPRLSPRSDSKSNMLSLVDAIKALVPEAVVHEYNILDAEEGDYLRDHDTEGEDEEGKRQTIIEEASHRAWKVRDTEIAESIDEDVEQVSGPKTFEHQNEEGCAQTLRHERFAEFSASWFEAKTTYLLKSIQKTECAHASADGGKCILAGYGLGGILIKQAGLVSSS